MPRATHLKTKMCFSGSHDYLPGIICYLERFLAMSEGYLENCQFSKERMHFVYLCMKEQLSWALKPHFQTETHLCHVLIVCS